MPLFSDIFFINEIPFGKTNGSLTLFQNIGRTDLFLFAFGFLYFHFHFFESFSI